MNEVQTSGKPNEVENQGAKIYYETFGEKNATKVIVFLAGSGTDRRIWQRQAEYFSQYMYVIVPDPRGAGKSDRPDQRYSAKLLASDIHAVVEAESVEKLVLVGYSMGGLIAQKFLNDHPEKVSKLVLMNCTLGGGNPDIVMPSGDVINTFLFAAALSSEDVVHNAIDYHFGKGYDENHPEKAQYYRKMFAENVEGVLLQVPILVSARRLIKNYEDLTTPVLCILAKEDVVTPVENGEVIKKYIPHAQVEYLEDHHASMLIHPEKVNEIIKKFVS